ncbi:MAG: cell wall/surface repeat protein [Symbiobacteriaceae bacterium]|nr:cell wall/surface repeat protein [Symbiobacteriaceae bacterium]
MVLMVALWPGVAPAAEALPQWHWRNPLPQGRTLMDVAFGNGRWVAVGQWALVTSADGQTWTEAPDGANIEFQQIAFGNGQFVATASGRIMSSTDGSTWTTRHTVAVGVIAALVYGEDRWVAINSTGVVYVSEDGVAWKEYLSNLPTSPWSVAYGAGRFMAVGSGGLVAVSSDGIQWSQLKGEFSTDFRSVAYGNGRFVVGAKDRFTYISEDGVAWEKGPLPIPEALHSDSMLTLIFDGRRFYGVMTAGTGHSLVASDDGVVWERLTPNQWPLIYGLAAGEGQVVAVGLGGLILGSSDGRGWTPRTGRTFGSFEAVAAGKGILVAVGRTQESGVLVSSPDGLNWTPRHSGEAQYHDVVFGGDRFVAVTSDAFTHSADGILWESTHIGHMWAPRHLAYGDGIFVAVGVMGTGLASANGRVWAVGSMPFQGWLFDVTYGNGVFVAVGEEGTILTSTNGLVWTQQASGTTERLEAVAYGQGQFMVVGLDSVLMSPDGKTWTRQPGAPGGQVSALAHTEYGFVAGFRYQGIQLWDPGTKGWRPWARMTTATIGDFEQLGDQLVAVGEWGTILTTGGPAPSPGLPADSRRPDAARSQVTVDRLSVPPDGKTAATVTVTLLDRDGNPVAGEVVSVRHQNSSLGVEPRAVRTDAEGRAAFAVRNDMPASVRYFVELPGHNMVLAQGVTVSFVTCAASFPDVPATSDYCRPIEEMVARRVVGGFPDGTFRPDGGLTRAELAKMLTVFLNKPSQAGVVLPFSDVAGHWAYEAGWIQAASALGAMTGYPDGTFQPDRAVSRAELIKAVMAAGQLPTVAQKAYKDTPAEAWYSVWVAGAQRAGVVGVSARWPIFTGSTLLPEQRATRAEAAVLLANLWDRLH